MQPSSAISSQTPVRQLSKIRAENENGPVWQVLSPIQFISKRYKMFISVPTGFYTDFASIPPLSKIAVVVFALAWLIGQISVSMYVPVLCVKVFALFVAYIAYDLCNDNRLDAPATVHDWLYSVQIYPRSMCDGILLEAMLANGVEKWKAYVVWLNVRMGGWHAWRQDHKKYGLK